MIVGAPRSGTTWVQRLLLSHPLFCGGQESQFFTAFRHVLTICREKPDLGRNVGLLSYWHDDELLARVFDLWVDTMGPLIDAAPEARVLVEKTPDHAIALPAINHLLPGCKVIHVIRDSRAVTASLLAASRSWGKAWAPRSAKDAAKLWCRYTRRARDDGRLLGSARYLEIRYEDLSADTTRCLARVFDFLGVDVTPSTLARMAADQRFEQQKATGGTAIPVVRGGSERGEPDGFFRTGLVDSWRAELSTIQKMIVWRYTGRLMRLLGYGWRGRTVTAGSQS